MGNSNTDATWLEEVVRDCGPGKLEAGQIGRYVDCLRVTEREKNERSGYLTCLCNR